MRKLLLVFLCCLCFSSYAQPGPFGGDVQFRVVSLTGKVLTRQDKDYSYFPTGKIDTARARRLRERASIPPFTWTNDGYLCFVSEKTPVGGFLPEDFTVNIVHHTDTMRVKGLADIRFGTLRVDAIPFHKGTYQVPSLYIGLLNMRSTRATVQNLNWEAFNVQKASKLSSIVAERMADLSPPITYPSRTDSLCFYSRSDSVTGDLSIYPAETNTKQQLPLFTGIHNLGLAPSACDGPTALVFLDQGEFFARAAVLRTDDGGATWKVYQMQEDFYAIRKKWKEYSSLSINKVWLEHGNVFARGTRRIYVSADGIEKKMPGIFQLHFDPDTTSAAFLRSRAKAQQDILQVTTALAATKKQRAIQSLHDAYHEHGPNRPGTRLVSAVFKESYFLATKPLLVLRQGKFSFFGMVWMDSVRSSPSVIDYNSTGSYTFTDSTITFQHNTITRRGTGFRWAKQFYPEGTYYYYLDKDGMQLRKWDDDIEYERGCYFSFKE